MQSSDNRLSIFFLVTKLKGILLLVFTHTGSSNYMEPRISRPYSPSLSGKPHAGSLTGLQGFGSWLYRFLLHTKITVISLQGSELWNVQPCLAASLLEHVFHVLESYRNGFVSRRDKAVTKLEVSNSNLHTGQLRMMVSGDWERKAFSLSSS